MNGPGASSGENKTDHKDDVKAYLDWLLGAINQYASQIRRTTIIALFLMAIFIIVSQSGAAITTKGINISKGSLVDIFIPALVACLFLQLVMDTNRLIDLYSKFSEKYNEWGGQSQSSDSYSLVMPPFPLIWGRSMGKEEIRKGLPEKAQRFLVGAIDVMVLIVGLGFLALAYWVLLYPPPAGHLGKGTIIIITTSIIITATCIVFASIAYWQISSSGRSKWRSIFRRPRSDST
jgi:hypothetical protein